MSAWLNNIANMPGAGGGFLLVYYKFQDAISYALLFPKHNKYGVSKL